MEFVRPVVFRVQFLQPTQRGQGTLGFSAGKVGPGEQEHGLRESAAIGGQGLQVPGRRPRLTGAEIQFGELQCG